MQRTIKVTLIHGCHYEQNYLLQNYLLARCFAGQSAVLAYTHSKLLGLLFSPCIYTVSQKTPTHTFYANFGKL